MRVPFISMKLWLSSEQSGNVDNLFVAYTGLGLAQEGLGDLVSAAKAFQKAVESVEEIRSTLTVPERSEFSTFESAGFFGQRLMRYCPCICQNEQACRCA